MATINAYISLVIKGLVVENTSYWVTKRSSDYEEKGHVWFYPLSPRDTSDEGAVDYNVHSTLFYYMGYDGIRHTFFFPKGEIIKQVTSSEPGNRGGDISAQFWREITQSSETAVNIEIDLDTTIDQYQPAGNISEQVKQFEWYLPIIINSIDSKISVKFNNSDIDPNNTEMGPFVWAKYSNDSKPSVLVNSPAEGSSLPASQIRPLISGSFSENSQSVDPESFKLYVDGKTIHYGDPNLSWTGNDFEFLPDWDLNRGDHVVGVGIEDRVGNLAIGSTSFSISDDAIPPMIEDCLPDLSEKFRNPLVYFSGNFSDFGTGLDISTFELHIAGQLIKPGTPGLTLNTSGYNYLSPVALSPGIYKYSVQLADRAGNVSNREMQFVLQPYNEKIGNLTLSNLRKIGGVVEQEYTDAGIMNIRDLHNKDPFALSAVVSQSILEITDHVNRAKLAYSEVFFPWDFPAILLEKTIIELANMEDALLEKYFIDLSAMDVKAFKKTIGILLMCIDNSSLNTLTLADFK